MSDEIDNAQSDAEAILSCLSSLAIMVTHADRLARHGSEIARVAKEERTRVIGSETLSDCAVALRLTRESMDEMMQRFGDFFNNNDACSKTMTEITKPMYEALRKRKDGISLDD